MICHLGTPGNGVRLLFVRKDKIWGIWHAYMKREPQENSSVVLSVSQH